MKDSNQIGANSGFAVCGAGDVNGDGFDDVLVGAPGYDDGQPEEGVVFVFHGSQTGLSTTPAEAPFDFGDSGQGFTAIGVEDDRDKGFDGDPLVRPVTCS